MEEVRVGNVALFAGAGISTESRNVLRWNFAEEVAGKLGIDPGEIAFPDLMEKFVARPNGRMKLISMISSRLDYIKSHHDLHEEATEFHKELGTIFKLNTVVTTNWDTNF